MGDYRDDEIPDYNLAVSVLDSRKNYRKTPDGYPKNGYGNVFAIDCEMIWVHRRKDGTDKRKNTDINMTLVKPYRNTQDPITGALPNLKGYRDNYSTNPDKAHSFIELLGETEIRRLFPKYFFNKKDKPITLKEINASKEGVDKLAIDIQNHFRSSPDRDIVHAVAQITITDINGYIIYDKFIKHEAKDVFWTNAYYCGISSNFYKDPNPKLSDGTVITADKFVNLSEMKQKIVELAAIPGSIFVGHAFINSDLPAMEIEIGTNPGQIQISKIRDTGIYYGKIGDRGFERPRLKNTIKLYLNKEIQISGAAHDPSEDARASLAIYLINKPRYDRLFNNNVESADGIHDPKYSIHSLLEMLVHYSSIHNKGTDKKAIIDKIIIYIKGLLN